MYSLFFGLIVTRQAKENVPRDSNKKGGFRMRIGWALGFDIFMLKLTSSKEKALGGLTNNCQTYFFFVFVKADCFVYSSLEVLPIYTKTTLFITLSIILYYSSLLISSL